MLVGPVRLHDPNAFIRGRTGGIHDPLPIWAPIRNLVFERVARRKRVRLASIRVHNPYLLVDLYLVEAVIGVDVHNVLAVRRPCRVVVVTTAGETSATSEGNEAGPG